MPTVIVTGAQWGDEGKGKVVDLLTEHAQVVVRYAGGHNAGHTIITGSKKYILHLIPSGILHSRKQCCLGNGMVLDPEAFLKEVRGLEERGVRVGRRLKISPDIHVIMPYHKTMDHESERLRGKRKIGTTGRGIGPAYVDKVARTGIRLADLCDRKVLKDKLEHNLAEKNYIFKHVYRIPTLDSSQIYRRYLKFGRLLEPYVADISKIVSDAQRRGRNVLFEGAQGTMLDVDHGSYPFVTSSNAIAGGACTGVGVGPTRIDAALGIIKAYTTRVGEGPFPTELFCDEGERLRDGGSEYGSTTGRPRRCGWFDAVIARYACRINGFTGLALTKLDVLDTFSEIKIAVGYRYKGKTLKEMPASLEALRSAEPVYRTVKGWGKPTSDARELQGLPKRARDYVKMLEDLVGCPFQIISTGAERDETIVVSNPFDA
ncbi:adenylosuccinate synthase [bacterium]|nr:adenylosuccinate synthase [bacterium]